MSSTVLVNPMTAASSQEGDQLILNLSGRWHPVRYQLQLMNRCRPPGLLPCSLRQRQKRGQLCVATSGCVSLTDWIDTHQPSPGEADQLVRELQSILTDMENHLLPADQLDLDPHHMFISSDTSGVNHLRLIFWPCRGGSGNTDLAADGSPIRTAACEGLERELNPNRGPWSEKQTLSMQAQDPSGPSSAGPSICHRSWKEKIFRYQYHVALWLLAHAGLGVSSYFLIRYRASFPAQMFVFLCTLIVLLIDIRGLLPKTVRNRMRQYHAHRMDQIRRQITILFQPRQDHPLPAESSRLRETGLYPDDPELFRIAVLIPQTDVSDQQKTAVRTTVHILVDQFVIGRDRRRSDLYLENASIGRQHARISRSGGSFFITDLNSRNGSWLDHQRLTAGEEVPLPDQCRLRFGQCQFLFQAED